MSDLDAATVGRAIQGDAAAQAELWQRYRRPVSTLLLAYRPQHGADVEDLVQAVALAFCRAIGGLREPERFEPWLMQIARNVARGEARRDRSRGATSLDGTESARDLASGGANDEDVQDVRAAIAALPEEYREPLLLKCVEGLSQRRIAELLGLPETTIETRLVRARRLVRQRLESAEAKENEAAQDRALADPESTVNEDEVIELNAEDRPDDREDLLLHRALERTASAGEWAELEQRSTRDPMLWKHLADRLRDEGRIAAAWRSPPDEARRAPPVADGRSLPVLPRFLRNGWLAAAAILALWLGSILAGSTQGDGRGRPSDLSRDPSRDLSRLATPVPAVVDDALVRVAADGRSTASELPRVLVDARRDGDAWELLYLCRSFERTRVPSLYGTARDENGNPAAVPVSLSVAADWEDF